MARATEIVINRTRMSSLAERWVAIIATGPTQQPLIEAAKAKGFKIIGIDRDSDNPLIDNALAISTFDTDEVLKEFKTNRDNYPNIEGVLCRSSGPALRTANALAELFGLKRYGDIAVRCSLSKAELFKWAEKNRVRAIHSKTIRFSAQANRSDTDVNVVVKPAIPLLGKKNVYHCITTKEYNVAIKAACNESLNAEAICQPYVEGRDIGVACLCNAGVLARSILFEELNNFETGRVKHKGMLSLTDDAICPTTKSRMRGTARKIVHQSKTTGFIFLMFRIDEHGREFLYEVNPGLCGDDLAEKVIAKKWNIDPFSLDVDVMSDQKFKI